MTDEILVLKMMRNTFLLLAVQEQVDGVTTAVAPYVDELSLTARPGPVREEVQHGLAAPLLLVEIIDVLGEITVGSLAVAHMALGIPNQRLLFA